MPSIGLAIRHRQDFVSLKLFPLSVKLTPKVALALLLLALVPLAGFGWVTLIFAHDTLIEEIETELRLNSDRNHRSPAKSES